MQSVRSSNVVRFGMFEVDLRAGELHKQGAKLRLPEQSFQILAMLLEHSGELVTREQIQRRLWPDIPLLSSKIVSARRSGGFAWHWEDSGANW